VTAQRDQSGISRRGLLQGFIGASATAGVFHAQKPSAKPLPARGEFIIPRRLPDDHGSRSRRYPGRQRPREEWRIVAAGKNVKAPPRATVIDGHRTIVMPGLVDTHWHMWTTYLRSMAGDKTQDGYFSITTRYGKAMEPIDMYRSTKLAAAEAINSGLTTVGDNCHNVRSHDYAVEDIRALQETGVRCRWSYGPNRGMPPDRHIDLEDLEGFHHDWDKFPTRA
jgi:predicted amidohydrolase YtcJ